MGGLALMGGCGSTLYILIFSVRRMTHMVPVVKNKRLQAFQ